VNEVEMVTNAQRQYANVYGQNYDSAYLFYPFNQPIGKAKSGILTLSKAKVDSARRYSLPVDTDFNKIIDLDRAFTATKTTVANGKQFIMVNIHMSAFTPNVKIQQAQFAKLFKYINHAYQQGNYVMVAGDYNHRLLKNTAEIFHTKDLDETWTHLFPKSKLPAGFYIPTMGLAAAKVPSVRALDQPYKPGKSFVTLIDGYILSPNIKAESVHVVSTGFQYSDHNPVVLKFQLK
jgi:endonuclease/exonuclease/phosphatase family metal-dependent hydrolase